MFSILLTKWHCNYYLFLWLNSCNPFSKQQNMLHHLAVEAPTIR